MTTDFQITDSILETECRELAQDIFDDVMENAAPDEDAEFHRDTMMDRAHEVADGHAWVIYNHKALMLCAHCDTAQGEDFLEDTGMPSEPDIYKLACTIAYGEIRARIEAALQDLIDAWEPAEDAE